MKETGENLVESEHYVGPERRRQVHLTEWQLDDIAERAAEKAVAKTVDKLTRSAYENIGRGVVRKLFYIIGAGAVALYVWAQTHGWIAVPKP